jgi:hypothetical protein
MARAANPRLSKTPGSWIWLFPATMALHVAEEAWTGETFPAWISRVAGVDLSLGEFLVLNAVALGVVVTATILARSQAWAVAALGTAMATNVAFHLGGALLTGSRSPGLATGIILWVPLATLALVHVARRARRRDLALGVAVGFAAHAMVSLALALA